MNNEVTKVPGGYTVEHLMPGFRIRRGKTVVAVTDSWRDVVANILVDREERRAIKS